MGQRRKKCPHSSQFNEWWQDVASDELVMRHICEECWETVKEERYSREDFYQ